MGAKWAILYWCPSWILILDMAILSCYSLMFQKFGIRCTLVSQTTNLGSHWDIPQIVGQKITRNRLSFSCLKHCENITFCVKTETILHTFYSITILFGHDATKFCSSEVQTKRHNQCAISKQATASQERCKRHSNLEYRKYCPQTSRFPNCTTLLFSPRTERLQTPITPFFYRKAQDDIVQYLHTAVHARIFQRPVSVLQCTCRFPGVSSALDGRCRLLVQCCQREQWKLASCTVLPKMM